MLIYNVSEMYAVFNCVLFDLFVKLYSPEMEFTGTRLSIIFISKHTHHGNSIPLDGIYDTSSLAEEYKWCLKSDKPFSREMQTHSSRYTCHPGVGVGWGVGVGVLVGCRGSVGVGWQWGGVGGCEGLRGCGALPPIAIQGRALYRVGFERPVSLRQGVI